VSNAPFYLLLGIVAIIVGSLGIGIYFGVTQGVLPQGALAGVCGISFIVIATIAFELLMKPGYYTRRRRGFDEDDEESPKP